MVYSSQQIAAEFHATKIVASNMILEAFLAVPSEITMFEVSPLEG